MASCGSLMATSIPFTKRIKSIPWIRAQNKGLLKETVLDPVFVRCGNFQETHFLLDSVSENVPNPPQCFPEWTELDINQSDQWIHI